MARKDVEGATALVFPNQLLSTLYFDLVHAALFLLALDVAGRHKDSLVGGLGARRVALWRHRVLALPRRVDVHSAVCLARVVQ